MSWQASTWALNLKLGNSTRKLVLMGYADHAHQDGKNAFIGVETVATYAECDKRTVQRHIRWLLEHGYMREGDQSLVSDFDPRYRPIVYELAMDDSTREQWEIDHASGGNARRAAAAAAGVKGGKATAKARGDNLSPLDFTGQKSGDSAIRGGNLSPLVRGDNLSAAGVTEQGLRGDAGVTQTIPQPSIGTNQDSLSDAFGADEATRLDVERLCKHLADRIEANGSKRPAITDNWRKAARLLLDLDGRTEDQVHKAIDWCQDDEFWRANVLGMPKLREKYDQMRLAAQRGSGARARSYDDSVWNERELRDTIRQGLPSADDPDAWIRRPAGGSA